MDENTECHLVSFVTEDSKDHPFSVVYGKEGLGKTTLVQKVYNRPEVRHKFIGRAWITVTHQVQAKTLWKDILSQIDYRRKDELKALTDQALVLRLKSALQSNKYLIVLDDICSMESLLKAMPADNKMPSKVVITTRNKKDTEKFVKKRARFLEMTPLTEAQSWQLFLKTQLHSHPSDFERKLKEMCRKCEGVPLAVKLLGNLIAWKESIDLNELQQQSCVSAQDLLELSCSLLPEHTKKCLHYLALFPKHSDIEAEKLCNLWIAEELIITSSQRGGMLSMAETYLKELATLGLVHVQEEETLTPTPTKIKSCSLPHYVQDFCSRKAKEESLFATMDLRPTHSNQETHSGQVRALAFYFDKRVGEYDFPLKPEVVRSILFLNTRQQDEHLLSPKSLVLKNCKLLRALDFNWINFGAMKFPQHINNLAYLSYLSFRDCYLEELPPSIGKLVNLETLDLRVNPKVVYMMRISNVLCQLRRLRSLYLPYKFEAIGDKKLELDGLSELENLQNFVSTHCRANDLSSLINLRFLAATIDGAEDLDVTIRCIREGTSKSSSISLKNIDFYHSCSGHSALSWLLASQFLSTLHVHGQLRTLSWPTSGKLTEIFLIGSELEEDPMPLLGNLPKLQKLGLSNSAFLGGQMMCRKSGFPQLRYLKLSNLPELRFWTLEERAMLNLSTLTIENCKSLETLPDGLISTHLQELSIVKMPKTFTDKYESQGEDFSKIQHVLSIKIL